MPKKINNIIPQMFDVRPVKNDGDLDFEKIFSVKNISRPEAKELKNDFVEKTYAQFSDIKRIDLPEIEPEEIASEIIPDEIHEKPKIFQLEEALDGSDVPLIYKSEIDPSSFAEKIKIPENNVKEFSENANHLRVEDFYGSDNFRENFNGSFVNEYYEDESYLKNHPVAEKFFSLKDILSPGKYLPKLESFGILRYTFSKLAMVLLLVIFGVGLIIKGLEIKNLAMKNGPEAYANLAYAKDGIMKNNFNESSLKFNEAYEKFDEISKELDGFSGLFIKSTRFIPYLSKASSGAYLVEIGKNVSRIGVLTGDLMKTLNSLKNPLDSEKEPISLLKIFQDVDSNSKEILALLEDSEEKIGKVNVDDIPKEQRVKFTELKSKLPEIKGFVLAFTENSQIFSDVLGGNGPRKYLFLFQNNQEMRATGGFIGTYGILDIFNGRIRKLFIDGIFNPDGQLREKVVPPSPIQKISAAWSLHDSNWFPDFPISAEKAMWFYEKTGGPTVDGVITMTPTVMQKLLEITGPIDMPDYDVTVDKDNFIEKIQYEVEVDYDKNLNQPKKILADLAPIILDRIFNTKNVPTIAKAMNILIESLDEKQILIYSKNYDIEKKVSDLGWSGEVLETTKDYASVINSNINGFKTDGIIDEKIEHSAEIQNDGSVIDTLTITRKHNGGNEKFDWWNKVNADYMRVYVPKGSQLISAEGQTREFNSPPLDYTSLGFKRDSQVQSQEDSMEIDEESGTKIFEDAGKTVFANWVYVSPQETVVVKYKYLLPFKVSMNNQDKPADTYSLLVQKQSGSINSRLISEITYPDSYTMAWKYPEEIKLESNNKFKIETDLRTDKFFGIAFIQP